MSSKKPSSRSAGRKAKKLTYPPVRPTRKTRRAYDYTECRDYLEAKYGYDERDYAHISGWSDRLYRRVCRKYKIPLIKYMNTPFKDMTENMKKANAEIEVAEKAGGPPYLDFWHWVIDNHEIHNGCYVTFSRGALEELEDMALKEPDKAWVRDIYKRYINEFADKKGELEMYVWW